jgi:DnaK suppressor protein
VTDKPSEPKIKVAAKKTASKKDLDIGNKGTMKTTTKATAKEPSKKKKTSAAEGFSFNGIEPYKEKKGEEYMNENQVAHFRKILLAWKKELMEEVDRTLSYMQDEAANFPDPNDRASQESDFTMELRTRDRERKLIKKIDESLDTLDSGDYGFCESCGIEIGIRRLEARPTATLCIDCKTLDEIKEKQRSS